MSTAIETVIELMNRLYDQLETHGDATASELAEALAIDRKRVYALIRYLRTYHGEEVIEKQGMRFALGLDAPRRVKVTATDRRWLAIAGKLLTTVGLPHEESFDRLFMALGGGNTEKAATERARWRDEVAKHLHFAEPVLFRTLDDMGLLTELYDACTARPRRPIAFDYESRLSPENPTRTVFPLGLVFNQAWYLVGYDKSHREQPVRIYALDRLSRLKTRAFDKNTALDDFNVSALMQQAWRLIIGPGQPQRVVLRMTPEAAAQHKHPSQAVEGPDGDGVRVAFWVLEPKEMAGFVLSHAGCLEVLEPSTLRDEVLRRLRVLNQRYGLVEGV